MKKMILPLLTLITFTANAGTPVHSSIYMALGAGSSFYFPNIKTLKKAILDTGLPVKDFELNQLSLNSASVDGTEVTYFHYKVYAPKENVTCHLNSSFKIDTQNLEIYEVKAQYSCSEDQD